MSNNPISLERDFLRQQFRITRSALGGLVGKSDTRSWSHPSKKSRKETHSKVSSFPKTVHKNSPDGIIYEYKKSFVPTNKHIDIVYFFKQFFFAKPKMKQKKKTQFRLSFFLHRLFYGLCLSVCLVLLAIIFLPSAYYAFFPADVVPLKTDQHGTVLGGAYAAGAASRKGPLPAPEKEESLPTGTWLIIPKIGVNTEILESAKPEDSLDKGVWRVPEFGTATDTSKPMILAAHRYGWKAWWLAGNQYWKYHSFYLLPDLVQGDLIQVIDGQRKYVYEVYAGEQAKEISDYNADLILYTCKFLDSPLRFFRYARRVDLRNPVGK